MAHNRNSLQNRKRKIEIVKIPDDGDYALRGLTIAEIDQWQLLIESNKGTSLPTMLALSLVDEKTGELLFPVDALEQVRAAIPYTSAGPLWKAALKLNGLEARTPAEQGTAIKNSEATQD
jgi:hypothetical protein